MRFEPHLHYDMSLVTVVKVAYAFDEVLGATRDASWFPSRAQLLPNCTLEHTSTTRYCSLAVQNQAFEAAILSVGFT